MKRRQVSRIAFAPGVAFVASAISFGAVVAQSTTTGGGASPASVPNGHRVVTLTDTLPGGVGGVAVDRAGMIYVADFANTVWRVTPAGEVQVFATGLYGASGNAIDSKGRLIQSNFHGHSLSRISRMGEVSTLATGFNGPVGVAIGPDDHMVVTNCSGNTLSKVTPEGEVTDFAESPLFACPNGITRAPDGTHFVVNFSDTKVLSVARDGTVSEFADLPGGGNGHITFANGSLWATSFRGNRVYGISLDGTATLVAGTGAPGLADGPALEAAFTLPNGIATNAQQNRLYINDFLIRPQGTELVPPAPRSILRQIKLASLSDRLAAALAAGGIDAMTETYREWKSGPSGGGFTELEMNGFGYALLSAGNLQAARRVFELNAESYPQSWNVYDSLGEALKALGE
ncbi:MAG: hypothetical protein HKN73_05685, partial [Gemmatimonadetes bacterium]|nr:hypothetical protein [Gemmatimonadota bacterium]